MTPKGLKWPGFDYPLNLHISQTTGPYESANSRFDYPLNLHISQTETSKQQHLSSFDYPLNLHISQTHSRLIECPPMFDYPLNLHISQTARSISNKQRSLIILWIYISLKLANQRLRQIVRLIILWIYISLKRSQWRQRWRLVWLSFEFTYLSNIVRGEAWTAGVWLSFEFTYLSNDSIRQSNSL